MKSIRDIYKIGKGPSSSHTMGPARAAQLFKDENPDADLIEVRLYGSLSKTGVGHGTDRVLREVLEPVKTKIIFRDDMPADLQHPNTLDFTAWKGDSQLGHIRVQSIGGGDILIEGRPSLETENIYPENSFAEIAEFCRWRNCTLSEYVEMNEGEEIWSFLENVWKTMRKSIEDGLQAEGLLPGPLRVERKAKFLYSQRTDDEIPQIKELRQICSYAFAVSEQNADNGTIVTAPTCGSCGVLPAALRYMQDRYNYSDDKVLEALAVAGLIGNLIKRNASISGAECGCQAEIGTASAMAASAATQLLGGSPQQCLAAAAIALTNLLGLVCDPVAGLVEEPCQKRNASAAANALVSCELALAGIHSTAFFDETVDALRRVGHSLPFELRETALGGIATCESCLESCRKAPLGS